MTSKSLLTVFCLQVTVLLCAASATFATSAIQPSDEDLVIGARAIVSGEVTAISTAAQDGIVYSYIRLRVEEVLKGELTTGDVVIKQPGGEAGDLGTMFYGMPRFEVGKRVLVYLDTWADGALRVHQWFLGKYDITSDALGQMQVVSRGGDETVSVTRQAGTVVTLNGSLDDYKAMVKEVLQANRVRARAFEMSAYGDLPILAEPVEYAAVQQSGEIGTQWTTASTQEPQRWFEADSNQAVTFYVNTAGAPAATAVDDVEQALNAWSQLSGSALRLRLGGETSGCGVRNASGQNTISFNNCDGYFSPSPGCSGLLAVGGIIRYTPSQSKSVNGRTFYKAVEAKVSVNPYALCNFKNRCDLIETLTHEIGHAIGLGHSPDRQATMYDYAQFDNRCAGVFGDDLEGIRAIYPANSGSGGVSIRTAADLPVAQAGAEFNAQLEARGGSGDYNWRLVSGMLPEGMTLGADGRLRGMTYKVGACNFIAEARDAAGRVSQAPFALRVGISSAAPVVTAVEFKKKKLTIYGANFTPSGAVYVNDSLIFTTIEATKIITVKRKLKAGAHTVVVKDSMGRESNRFTLTL